MLLICGSISLFLRLIHNLIAVVSILDVSFFLIAQYGFASAIQDHYQCRYHHH